MDLRINGCSGYICTVRFESTWCAQDLKVAVEGSSGIPAASQRLFQGLRELVGSGSLGELHRVSEEVLLVRRSQEQVAWLWQIERSHVSQVCSGLRHAAEEASR